ncbi:MAG: BON domain-containing protein [Candidatus Rokubacteria bacterium]|nr:BON domain-containing protein [Candidatus Rokubacteria bacterium]
MPYPIRSLVATALLAVIFGDCTAVTGKTLGENIDDASITATVKWRLAREKAAILTSIDVDTNRGTVYLSGTVESAAMKRRAVELAREVQGVREVIDNIKVRE